MTRCDINNGVEISSAKEATLTSEAESGETNLEIEIFDTVNKETMDSEIPLPGRKKSHNKNSELIL